MIELLADFREMYAEQLEYHELLWQMTKRDLLLRYKQTAMGFAWAVFMPLVNTAVFSVVFMKVAPVSTPVPYPVFAFCGLWVWSFFASALRFSVTSLTGNLNLVSKVYFPREVFPFSAVLVSSVDFAVGAVVMGGLLVWFRIPVGLHVLWLPVVLAVHILFTAAVALLLAMGNLFYRDVKYLFEVVITVWMFASSTVYPVKDVHGWAGLLLQLNPMTAIIDAYRAVLLLDASPARAFWIATIVSLVITAVAWRAFHRAEFEFAERL